MGDTKAPRSGAGPSSHFPIDMSDAIRHTQGMTTTRFTEANTARNAARTAYFAAVDADSGFDDAPVAEAKAALAAAEATLRAVLDEEAAAYGAAHPGADTQQSAW